MRLYQFLFFDPEGRSPVLDFAECLDDGAAVLSAGQQLALHGACQRVDVFDGERMVLRLERPPAGIALHGA